MGKHACLGVQNALQLKKVLLECKNGRKCVQKSKLTTVHTTVVKIESARCNKQCKIKDPV